MVGRKRISISSQSTTPQGKKKKARSTKTPPIFNNSSSILSKLQKLRDFLKESGCDHFKEDDISKCLRQCGFHVERALERLITGQFPCLNDNTISITNETLDSNKLSNKKESSTQNFMVDLTEKPDIDLRSNDKLDKKTIGNKEYEKINSSLKISSCKETTVDKNEDDSNILKNKQLQHLLLAKRWIVGCNNIKGGSISYNEILQLKHSNTGPPIVRFKGKKVEGTLPHALSRILTPLLRYNCEMSNHTNNQIPLLNLYAQTLMEDSCIPVGGEVPLALTVYIENPIAFFEIFSTKTKSTKKFISSTFPNSRYRKKQVDISQINEAAFALLQWAQYGPHNTPHFEPSETNSNLTNKSESSNNTINAQNTEMTEEIDPSCDEKKPLISEEQFNAEVTSNNTPKWADELFIDSTQTITSKDNDNDNDNDNHNKDGNTKSEISTILPQADDPIGFTKDVTLRSYQKQALHWMIERESGTCSKEYVTRDLALITDFAAASSFKHNIVNSNFFNEDIPDHGIKCDCGPVLVSEEKAKSSCSVDGDDSFIMDHPLWQRRYLTTEDKECAFSFYVNEYLSIASSKPPNPPKQCEGGILADAMGLGKTIMLIALILSNRISPNETMDLKETGTEQASISSDCKSIHDEESVCSTSTEKIEFTIDSVGETSSNLSIIDNKKDTCNDKQNESPLPTLSQKASLHRTNSLANSLQTTLVVTPLSLLYQWEYEITTKSNLSCFIHYGDSTNKTHKLSQNDAFSFFDQYDVVLTSYGTVQMEYISMSKKSNDFHAKRSGLLLSHEWKRVILDEAHCIKNPTTAVSKGCCALKGGKRWVVTGTPIQNSLQDVYGLLKFLKHEPWCEATFWKATISNVIMEAQNEYNNKKIPDIEEGPCAKGLKVALSRVKRVISPIMLRRTKDMKDNDGNLIITLPPIESRTVEVIFSKAERRLYTSLLNRSQEVFGGYLKNGTARKSWFAIFSLLARLRQVCDHVSLIVKNKKVNEESIKDKIANTEMINVKHNDDEKGIDEKFLKDILLKFNEIENNKNEKGSTSTFASEVAHTLTQSIQSESEQIDQECPICLEDISCNDCMLTPCAHMFCKPCLLLHVRKNASIEKNEESDDKRKQNLSSPKKFECPICNEMTNVNNVISISKSPTTGKTCSSFYFRSGNHETEKDLKKEESKDESVKQILETALCGATSSKLTSVMNELDNIWDMDPCSKVLIFSQFLGFLDVMESSLKERKISNYRIDGSMTLKERMNVLDKFNHCQVHHEENNKRGSVFLASMKVGGVGINLVAASTVFIVDPWWNAAIEDQCINRIHRIGQNASVVRVRKFIVQDSVEEKIVFLQKRKKDMASEILSGKEDGGAFTDSKPSIEDFKILFGL